MKKAIFYAVLTAGALLLVSSTPGSNRQQTSGLRIIRHDPALDKIITPDATIEKIVDGYTWLEGPVWDRNGGYLLFSEIPSNSIFRWQPNAGPQLYLRPSGYTGEKPFEGREPGSNGLAIDANGRLISAEHGDRRIARLEKDGHKTTLAASYEGKRLNSPNDLVYKSNGDLYFTDPPFGLPKTFDDPAKELPFQGVYKLAANGTLTLLTKNIKAPNGIAFSPDERTLYISNAEASNAVWYKFQVNHDGSISNQRVFFDATTWTTNQKGVPDGMKVDHHGNLFAAGPGGLHIFSKSGLHLGTIAFDATVSNCAWGNDGSTLYITANSAIYRIQTSTKGAGWSKVHHRT